MRKISKSKYKKKIIILLIIIIVLIPISIILYKNYKKNEDVFKDKNVLMGIWLYNEYGGTYIFNKDYTYIQYSNEYKKDNYCTGKYKYSYGGKSDDGIVIRQDENYYYYNLDLLESYCIIMGKEDYSAYKKEMVFALSKKNKNNILINKESENIFTLTKVN